MKRLSLILLFLLLSTLTPIYGQSTNPTLFPQSPLRIAIPANATYTAETRIGTFRNTYTDYSGSFGGCRVPVGTTLPLVRVTVTSSGRIENWQIPTTCRPDTGSDHHLNAANYNTGFLYECWDCTWNSSNTALSAGGAVDYAIAGSGITTNPNHRTTAAGFSEAMGQIRLEDMSACDTALPHGLTIALPTWAISQSFISPAVGGEENGRAPTPSGIPMGARFALPRSLNVDSLQNIEPFTRTVLRAAQTYGLMVADGNSAANFLGRANGADYAATGTFRIEQNVLDVCGVENDDILATVGNQVGAVIAQYGLFRVTFNGGATVTPATIVPSVTRTPTPISTATFTRTPTRTPTATGTVTLTPISTPTVACFTGVTQTPLHILIDCH